MRVAVAVRGFEPYRHLPALTRPQVLRLALQLQRELGDFTALKLYKAVERRCGRGLGGACRSGAKTRIPAKVDERWQRHGLPIELRRFDSQSKPHPVFTPLRHGLDFSSHRYVFAFKRRVQGGFLKSPRPQAGQTEA